MIKIAVPWPFKVDSQQRIKESLDLWEDKDLLLVCMVDECSDKFLNDYDTVVLERNSSDIGTQVPKCYIYDMVKAVMDKYPDCDWVGFGNSDCVPVGDMIEDKGNFESLIYHRTDIPEWENRLRKELESPIPAEVVREIWKSKQNGESNKRICRKLNRMGIKPPNDEEWNYLMIDKLFLDNGTVFFWGQDMYLFKKDVVQKVMDEYLKVKDPILGTGGFDPRLSRWLSNNTKAARVVNKIFHKIHNSEWAVDEIEYHHNGGDIDAGERAAYFEDTFLLSLCESGQKGIIPKYIKYLVGKENPELYQKIVNN